MEKFLITFGLILISAGFIIHLFGDILIWFSNLIGDLTIKAINAYLLPIYQYADC